MINKSGQRNLRHSRYVSTGFFYFITTVTKNREKIFLQPFVATIVLDALKWLDANNRIKLIAAVVMPEHIHFVAELINASLAKVLHSLKSYSANRINGVLERTGQVWEHQYYEHAIRNEKSLLETVKYCLENPVRKGIVEDLKEYPHWYCVYDL